jgi:hypothetical protein
MFRIAFLFSTSIFERGSERDVEASGLKLSPTELCRALLASLAHVRSRSNKVDSEGILRLEYGWNNSPEDLNQGFDLVLLLSTDHAFTTRSMREWLNHVSRTMVPTGFDSRYIAVLCFKNENLVSLPTNPQANNIDGFDERCDGPIRHLVAWRFDKTLAHADKHVERASEGYRKLPLTLPYFSQLEVGSVEFSSTEINDLVTEDLVSATNDDPPACNSSICLIDFSCAMLSTFYDRAAQQSFVNDTRRKQFKSDFVAPYLSCCSDEIELPSHVIIPKEPVLVIDYFPIELKPDLLSIP